MSEKKKSLSEADICHRYITPAIHEAGWAKNQIRMEYQISAGQIVVRGKVSTRKKARRADYVLFYKPNLPLAVVEAKDNKHVVGAGMQQALAYSKSLDVPFVFSSNGDAFLFHDWSGHADQIESDVSLDSFPTPDELWKRYKVIAGPLGRWGPTLVQCLPARTHLR